MGRKQRFDHAKAITMFCDDHLTLREIGIRLGTSFVSVYRALQKAGIAREQGTWVKLNCDYCGAEFKKTRGHWAKTQRHFCCEDHYFKSLHNPNYVSHRQGQRIARKRVAEHFILRDGNVVHHVDSNETNNVVSNLWVFHSQAAHMAYHRGMKIKPIWKGSSLG